MGVHNRLKELRAELGLTQKEFAQKINKSAAIVQQWEYGTSVPHRNSIGDIEREFGINPDWLLTGKGEMFAKTRIPTIEELRQTIKKKEKGYDNDELVSIPCFNHMRVSAGFGLDVFDEAPDGEYLISSSLLPRRNKNIKCIKVSGNSMAPRFDDGDYVFVDVSEQEVRTEAIYVIRVGSVLLVKKVQWLPNGLKLISENKEFEPVLLTPETYNPEDIQIIGRVIGIFAYC